MSSHPWYLILNHQQHPIALFEDRELALEFLRDSCPGGSLSKVDVSHCVVHPIIETINEHHPIVLGRTV
jgi:hypothetical protein